ncbi:MAG: hypothetical protein ACXWBN_19300 [Acidimicrobiales bacterium]
MSRTDPVIRLVGGPRPLDGSTYDPSTSPHDRADLDGDRFVRAVRGSSVMPLAALRERCTDRVTAEELAGAWGCAVFAYGRDRRLRTRYFRYQATYRLRPTRDERGAWTLEVAETVAVADEAVTAGAAGAAPEPDLDVPSTWTVLEHAVDEAAARFATVAGLLPDGPLAERADSTRVAVGACVSDAARLCGVGIAVAPDWRPGDAVADPEQRAARLASRVAALVGTIDEATTHLVDLHLEIGDGHDPVEPLAHLRSAWTELGLPR